MGLAEQVERLQAENAELKAKVEDLTAKLEALQAELETLRRERERNSGNSGKPPSSDTLAERAKVTEERLSRAERRRLAREKAKRFMKERDAAPAGETARRPRSGPAPNRTPRPYRSPRAQEMSVIAGRAWGRPG